MHFFRITSILLQFVFPPSAGARGFILREDRPVRIFRLGMAAKGLPQILKLLCLHTVYAAAVPDRPSQIDDSPAERALFPFRLLFESQIPMAFP
jgi:hypothetical protein